MKTMQLTLLSYFVLTGISWPIIAPASPVDIIYKTIEICLSDVLSRQPDYPEANIRGSSRFIKTVNSSRLGGNYHVFNSTVTPVEKGDLVEFHVLFPNSKGQLRATKYTIKASELYESDSLLVIDEAQGPCQNILGFGIGALANRISCSSLPLTLKIQSIPVTQGEKTVYILRMTPVTDPSLIEKAKLKLASSKTLKRSNDYSIDAELQTAIKDLTKHISLIYDRLRGTDVTGHEVVKTLNQCEDAYLNARANFSPEYMLAFSELEGLAQEIRRQKAVTSIPSKLDRSPAPATN